MQEVRREGSREQGALQESRELDLTEHRYQECVLKEVRLRKWTI